MFNRIIKKLTKIVEKKVEVNVFVLMSLFLVAVLVGSMITKHNYSVWEFIRNQRGNMIIGISTGLISGLILTDYFRKIDKDIEMQKLLNEVVMDLISIRYSLSDGFKGSNYEKLMDIIKYNRRFFYGELKKYKLDPEMKKLINIASEIPSDIHQAILMHKSLKEDYVKKTEIKLFSLAGAIRFYPNCKYEP